MVWYKIFYVLFLERKKSLKITQKKWFCIEIYKVVNIMFVNKEVKSTILDFLYSAPNFEVAIQEAIAYVGEMFDVSRVYIFENTDDDRGFSNTFEWCNEGIPPEIDNLQNIKYADMDNSYQDNFDADGIFFCSDIATLPQSQYEILEPQGIKAMLQCSIVENGNYKGMIGFDDCNERNRNWKDEPEKIEALVFMAHVFSLYLLKERHLAKILREQEKIQAMEKEKIARDAKNRFFSFISHDMRIPLNAMLGLTDILDSKLQDTNLIAKFNNKEAYQSFFDDINTELVQIKNAERFLLNIINDTLDSSKLEHGNFTLHPVVCNVKTEFSHIVAVFENIALQKNITLNFASGLSLQDKDIHTVLFYIDPVRISQIFFNIISNSVKFSETNSKIDLRSKVLKIEDNVLWAQFDVCDYGVGMDEEFIDRIFIPFEQEVQSGTVTYHGTGLGMPIVKQIVEIMGGTIEVHSKKNEGTTFVIVLPLAFATPKQISDSTSCGDNIPQIQFAGMNILVFEDNALNAKIMRHCLEKMEFHVDIAENGKVGLEMFTASAVGYYNAVLMDMRMPIMGGLEATQKIRSSAHEQAKSLPIIGLSGDCSTNEIEEAFNAGMNSYLPKPVDVKALRITLSKLCSAKVVA